MPVIYVIAFSALAVVIFFLTHICSRRQSVILQLQQRLASQETVLGGFRQQLEMMFSSNPYPMFTFDQDSLRFLAVNEAAVQAYGYSREEFLQMTLLDIRPKEDIPSLRELLKQEGSGYVTPGVRRHQRKDGRLVYVEIMAFRFVSEEGPVEMCVALDVTERLRVEQALRESESSLKTLIDNAPFGIAQNFFDDDRLRTLNPALLHMLGEGSLEEAQRLHITQIYGDPKERERLLDVLRHNGKIEGWETNFRRRDGTTVPVRISGSVTIPEHGGPQVFSAYVEDMTQQSKLEQQVRQVQKLEAVGRLAGGMAHDFNNILVVIKLSTEMMLAQVTPDSPFSKPLLQISNASDRAAGLTRQMLAFGRQQIMQPRIIKLNNVVSDTTMMLRRVIGEDIELATNLAEDIENCRLDPDQVGQVILNLAVNARDAMPKGGLLHLETANADLDDAYAQQHPPVQPGRYVMLAVSDTGTGIDSSVLPRIFDPFFTTKEVGKGTGLGLSIVYGIVKQSGGYIWVYSDLGHGTTFKLYFPAISAPIDSIPLRAEGGSRVSGQTVMVVEDEPAIRMNIRDCLQQLGYRVLEAENGVAALQTCDELHGEIDLVLTDLVMAGKSGHDLAIDLAEIYPAIRVLFMSGYTEDTAARRDILLRGGAFLPKPFSVADLAKAVEDALATTPALASEATPMRSRPGSSPSHRVKS